MPIESAAKQWNRIRNSLVPPRSLVLLSIFLAYLSRRLYIQSTLQRWNRGICQPLNRTARRQQAVCERHWQPHTQREGQLSVVGTTTIAAVVASQKRRQKGYAEKYLHWAECFFSEFTELDIVSFRGKTGQVAFSLTPTLSATNCTPWLDQRKSQPSRSDVLTFDSLIKTFRELERRQRKESYSVCSLLEKKMIEGSCRVDLQRFEKERRQRNRDKDKPGASIQTRLVCLKIEENIEIFSRSPGVTYYNHENISRIETLW